MLVKELFLKDFRNYHREHFTFSAGTNILYGGNAQGKTNALEAVYLFSVAKSFRTTQDKDFIAFDRGQTVISAVFESDSMQNDIEMIIRRDKKKQIKVNGVPIRLVGELLERTSVVLFSPDELNLTKGSPHIKRRFLDIGICQMKPRYYHILRQYNKILEQRNNLIKKLRFSKDSSLADTIDIWNERLADYGSYLMTYRGEFTENLYKRSEQILSDLSGETFCVRYKTNTRDKADLKEKLTNHFARELEQGFTLFGPHRDDVEITMNGKDIKLYGSQGQHRSAVLSLKLAQAELIYDTFGEYPVLLLDDIMSELDSSRREYLSKKIRDKQVILTCTDPEEIADCAKDQLIHIENGAIVK